MIRPVAIGSLAIVALFGLSMPVKAEVIPADILQQDLETIAANDALPSMVAILFDRTGPIWSGAVGTTDPGKSVPAGVDSVYRAGSISKLVTALLAMQEVEAGRLDLDQPVAALVPAFAPQNQFRTPVTLRHLLSHRSGLVREPPLGSYFDAGDPGIDAVVASLSKTSLVYAPGSRSKYSNAGFAVVAKVLEARAGMPFADLAGERLFTPFGMTASSFTAGGPLARAEMAPPGGLREPAPVFDLGLSGAGMLTTSPADLARLGTALLRVAAGSAGPVSPKTLALMSDDTAGAGRAMGLSVGRLDGNRRIGHGGAIYGFTADFALLPDANLGVIAMATVDGSPAPFRFSDIALRRILAARSRQPRPLPVARTEALPAAASARLIGHYLGPDGPLFIRGVGNQTFLEGPRVAAEIRLQGGMPVLYHDIGWSGEQAIDPEGREIKLGASRYVRAARPKPPAVSADLAPLVGYYRRNGNELVVYERAGRPHINIEWSSYEPMAWAGRDRLAFRADSGLYPDEALDFIRGPAGDVVAASLNGIRFDRAAGVTAADAARRAETARRVPAARVAALSMLPPKEAGSFLEPDLVNLRELGAKLSFDIAYATPDNFLGAAVYRKPVAFLQRPAAEALARASRRLAADGLGLVVRDGYRPWYVTRIFWDLTPDAEKVFVADPAQGSRHNRAAAIDVTLRDLTSGVPADAPGGYDEPTPRSYVGFVGGTDLQRWRRDRLLDAMQAEGFDLYPQEWWHFDFRGWQRYPILNIEVD